MNLSAKQVESFWAKVDKGEGCWQWNARTWHGYGRFSIRGRDHQAHRISYELLVGPIAQGLEVDHLCRNRLCVNPAHLEPVSHRENQIRGWGVMGVKARQTHCVRGHEFTPENTLMRKRATTQTRLCRECSRIRCREQRLRRKAATTNPLDSTERAS